jgi:hypothetical protein
VVVHSLARASALLAVSVVAVSLGWGCGDARCGEPTGEYLTTSVEKQGGTCGSIADTIGPIRWSHAEKLPGETCFGTREVHVTSDLCEAQLVLECDDAALEPYRHRRTVATLSQVDGIERIEGTSIVDGEDHGSGEQCHSEYDVTITKQ